jgi:hypothetical protein
MRKLILALAISAPLFAQCGPAGQIAVMGGHKVCRPKDGVPVKDANGNLAIGATLPLSYRTMAWGDSYTEGNQDHDGVSYPSALATLTGRFVYNVGVGGQTSTQIAVRVGATAPTVTITGGTIPASGGVQVTFPAGYEPVTTGGPAVGVAGTISGVHGVVTLSSGTYTFTRTVAGNSVSVATAPFQADVVSPGAYTIIWAGRNNYAAAATVKADIAAMVAAVGSSRYLVLGIPNCDFTSEYSGQASYTGILQLNTDLAALYPGHFLDPRPYLVAGYNPALPQDVIDHGHDTLPASLRAHDGTGTLVADLNDSATTFQLTKVTGEIVAIGGQTLTIGTEKIYVKTVTGSSNPYTVTDCTRGYAGTTAAAHSTGDAYTALDPVHLNAAGYTLVAQKVADWLKTAEPSTALGTNNMPAVFADWGFTDKQQFPQLGIGAALNAPYKFEALDATARSAAVDNFAVAAVSGSVNPDTYTCLAIGKAANGIPIAKICTKKSGAGSELHFLVSQSYTSGITRDAFQILPGGNFIVPSGGITLTGGLQYRPGTEGGCGVYNDFAVDAATNTKVSSASYTFVSADAGGRFQVTGGTGWTSGNYIIVGVSGGAATLDASPAAVGTTGGIGVVNRSRIIPVEGGAGAADTFRVCRKDAANAYAWTALY